MTATILARRMVDGLSDAARQELRDTLAELSQTGHAELVQIFEQLLAGQDMITALGLPEGTVDLLYAQAHARFNSGHPADALGLFQALTVLAPQVKDHWLGLGICLRVSDALDSARLAFATALELDPDCPALAYHMAELALAQSRLAEAAEYLSRYAALPDSLTKRNLMAEVGRTAAAISARTGR